MNADVDRLPDDSSEDLLTNNDCTTTPTFATEVKELANCVSNLLNNDETSRSKQTGTENEKWLSKSQRKRIENSWKQATKNTTREQVGIQLFGRILTAQPDMKYLFGLQKIPEGRLKYDPRFRRHGIVFTKSFDYIVKNIDYKEKLVQHFQALGERHTTFQKRGFDPKYWDTFEDCMKQTVSFWGRNKDYKTSNAWNILISFVLKNMKIGFDRANNRHTRRMPRTLHDDPDDQHNESSKRQEIDPIQFYKQFCLQKKKQKIPHRFPCIFH